jgi:hypothetical protein
LEGVEARTIEWINNAQINNVFVAADRFAEFVGKMNRAIEAMPAHDRLNRKSNSFSLCVGRRDSALVTAAHGFFRSTRGAPSFAGTRRIAALQSATAWS